MLSLGLNKNFKKITPGNSHSVNSMETATIIPELAPFFKIFACKLKSISILNASTITGVLQQCGFTVRFEC